MSKFKTIGNKIDSLYNSLDTVYQHMEDGDGKNFAQRFELVAENCKELQSKLLPWLENYALVPDFNLLQDPEEITRLISPKLDKHVEKSEQQLILPEASLEELELRMKRHNDSVKESLDVLHGF